jgi:UDP-N-acetylmuramate dehydrogenase
VRVRENVPLAELTTLRLGGPARRLVEAVDADEAVAAVREVETNGQPLLVMAGGSNLVVADEGFAGTVVRVASRGVARNERDGRVELEVAAGEVWDEVVAGAVADGLAGIECLSGIPGATGATPIQNVGAYGQEVAETISWVRVYDREAGSVGDLAPDECGFSYRSSAFRRSDRHVVLAVAFSLPRSARSAPVRYAELARVLGVELGATAPLHEVREAVLALRRSKGMVVDPADPDSVSAGSFFTNPILDADAFAALEARATERLGADARPPRFPEPDGRVKTSAAWLIERAGFGRGYGDGRVRLSDKHTLAITNRGGGTAAELVVLARELRDGVREAFGVTLEPEPTLVGLAL